MEACKCSPSSFYGWGSYFSILRMFRLQYLFAKVILSQNAGDDFYQHYPFLKWRMLRLGVLKTSLSHTYSVNPPSPMNRSLRTTFASFYLQQHRGRSLRWCPAWGQCLLRANYCGGRKELVVSHFQAWNRLGRWIGIGMFGLDVYLSEVKEISKRMFTMAYECIRTFKIDPTSFVFFCILGWWKVAMIYHTLPQLPM